MERILKLFRYVDGKNDIPFPSAEEQIEIGDFEYSVGRMGSSPTITAVAKHRLCLDNYWGDKVYAEFNGEKYFVLNTPSSRKNNTDERYEHDLDMLSERDILNHVLFFDAVDPDGSDNDKAKTNSTEFSFMGDIREFASRLTASFRFSKIDYRVIIDSGVKTDDKLVTFKDKYLSEALQEMFNIYKVPFYFVGKDIHIGFTSNVITKPFKYGAADSLLSISKDNANFKVVNRITGVGSSDNLPYYYPNETSKGSLLVVADSANKGLKQENLKFTNKTHFADNFKISDRCIWSPILGSEYYVVSDAMYEMNGSFVPYTAGEKISYWGENVQHIVVGECRFMVKIEIKSRKKVYFIPKYIDEERTITETKEYKMHLEDGTPFKSGMELNEGSHKIYIDINVRTRRDPFEDYPSSRLYASFKYDLTVSKTNGWTIDGREISLSSIGIEIVGSPKVEIGDSFTQELGTVVPFSNVLMPPIYRQTDGRERFYNAENGKYKDEYNNFYVFNNLWSVKKPLEAVQNFDDIKPTILNVRNSIESGNEHINQFLEFAYDRDDNDELVEGTNEYQHPYFFAKLRKTDGDFAFNLFDSANEKSTMTISMTSGVCGACNFEVGVGENSQKNIVQVDENGNLLYDETTGNVIRSGTWQKEQNDTIHNEVWIALKKDISTYKTYVPMPNVKGNLRPSVNDTFVITGITLPQAYILAAEKKLEESLIRYMHDNNDEKFSFSIAFSRIYLENNPSVLSLLDENARISVEYDGSVYQLYVQDYSYKMSGNAPLPEISVTLADEITPTANSLQKVLDSVKFDVTNQIVNTDIFSVGSKHFMRRDMEEYTNFLLNMYGGATFGAYNRGISGASINDDGDVEVGNAEIRGITKTDNIQSRKFESSPFGNGFSLETDEVTNQSKLTIDDLFVRNKMSLSTLEIKSYKSIGGSLAITPASMDCVKVEELADGYKCYFNARNAETSIKNEFKVDDLVLSSEFNIRDEKIGVSKNRRFWRRCTEVGSDYIVLSKSDAAQNSSIPMAGDTMVTMGNKTDKTRQNAIVISSYGNNAPYIIQYANLDTYSFNGKEVTIISKTLNKFNGSFYSSTTGENIESTISQTESSINLSIKNLLIGGDNMYQSNSPIGFRYSVSPHDPSIVTEQTSRGFVIRGSSNSGYETILSTPFINKGWYSMSLNVSAFDIPVQGGIVVNIFVGYGNVERKIGVIKFDTRKSPRYLFQLNLGDDYNEGTPVFIIFRTMIPGIYNFIDLKLEAGIHSTAWSPSKYDFNKGLLDTGINIESNQITVTADKFKVRANDGTKYIDVFKDREGKPVIEAPNLNIDSIEAINCKFRKGTMSGLFLREPTEINPQNIDGFIYLSESKYKMLKLDKIGNMMVIKGAFDLSGLFLELPNGINDETLNYDTLSYIGSKITIINRSAAPLYIIGYISGSLSHSGYLQIVKDHIVSLTCDMYRTTLESDRGFFVGWKLDYNFKLDPASPLLVE